MKKATLVAGAQSVDVVAPGFWSSVQAVYGMVFTGVNMGTRALRSADNILIAAEAQSEIIRDTSVADAAVKRIALDERIAARKAKSPKK